MTRISKIYVVSSMLAALALSANAAIAKGGNHGGGSSAGNAVTGTTNTGKAKFNEFTVKKTTDSASPKLFKNAVKGTHYKKVTIVSRKAGGPPPGGQEAARLMTKAKKVVQTTIPKRRYNLITAR